MRSASIRLRRDAARGDRLALSAMTLASKADNDQPQVLYSAPTRGRRRQFSKLKKRRLSLRLQDLSAIEERSEDLDREVHALSGRLDEDSSDPDAALGLALCAARLGRTEEAYVFATESMRRGGKHPRAFCIAGLCELETGDKVAAQQHLAAATRLARLRPELRSDLRMAQRLLLILNFGAPRSAPAA